MNQQHSRSALRAAYSIDFPDDLFAFWDFVQGVDKKILWNAIGIHLEGPFELLAGNQVEPPHGWHLGSRYYDDPPEFVTAWSGDNDGLHWGYWFDDPDHLSDYCIASYYSRDAFEISNEGHNLFEAFRLHLERVYSSTVENIETDPEVEQHKAEYEADLENYAATRELLGQYALKDRQEIGDDYLEQYEEVDCEREITAATPDGMGIVVPPHLYHSLSISDEQLLGLVVDEKDLTPLLQEADQRLLAGYAGTALQLGKNLWIGSALQNQEAYRLLANAYQALDRPTLADWVSKIASIRTT